MEAPAGPVAASATEPSIGRFLLYLWRLSRPEAWMVSLLPLYTGWLLASRSLVPGLDDWAVFWSDAVATGATFDAFRRTFTEWLRESWRLLAALVVFGPLLWLATLLINDVHDLAGDRANPRKARSPLVQGLIARRGAHAAAYAAAAAALLLAALVGPAFAALTLVNLALAWAYSVPPVRLKTRPGMDVAVNALGVGVVSALAGWTLAAPLAGVPWWFLPQGLLVAAAVYVPTTLVDYEADRATGYRTLATHLGPGRAYAIGWWSWVLANAGALALSWNNAILPRGMFPLLVIFVPVLLYEYHAFIGGARDGVERVRGIVLTSVTFLAVNLVWALMYTGLWTA